MSVREEVARLVWKSRLGAPYPGKDDDIADEILALVKQSLLKEMPKRLNLENNFDNKDAVYFGFNMCLEKVHIAINKVLGDEG